MAGKRHSKRGVWKLTDGQMVPAEKRSVENLPEHLRVLPADLVTKDEGDEDRIHETDAPHIVDALREEYDKRQQPEAEKVRTQDAMRRLGADTVGERVPLRQDRVDLVRARAFCGLITGASQLAKLGRDYGLKLVIHHLWFPEDNVNEYELRVGNPPPDNERPKHLRRLVLWIDPLNPPETLIQQLNTAGVSSKEIKFLTQGLAASLFEASAAWNKEDEDGSRHEDAH